jgi:EmrB/QacA subfamily drug resistance transporter
MVAKRQDYRVTLAILTLAGSAFALQQTLVFPVLSTFQNEFDSSTAWTTWILTGFLVSAAVATPVMGRLGDQFGKKRLLVISLGVFLLGCIGAAAAWNLPSLIGFRVLAGVGGAVFPLSFGIIRDEFPADRVKVGLGLLSTVFGFGGGLGIVLSGVIVDHVSWRWLFVLGSIPVAATVLLVRRFVPESPVTSPSRIDVSGALLLASALVSLMLALTQGERWGWTSMRILGLSALSAVLFLMWGLVERRLPYPMVDMRTFGNRPVLLTNVVTLIAGFALFSCFVLVPAFVETPSRRGYGFGATATEAALYLLPSSLALLFAGPLAGLMGRRWGSKWPLAAGMGLVYIGALSLAAHHQEPWNVLLSVGMVGVGVGFAFAAMPALITDHVEATETGVATGINTVARMVGSVVGGQVAAALLTAQTIGRSSTPAESAFDWAFGLGAAAALAACFIALFIERTAASSPPTTAAAKA